jgi:hypothetical protein
MGRAKRNSLSERTGPLTHSKMRNLQQSADDAQRAIQSLLFWLPKGNGQGFTAGSQRPRPLQPWQRHGRDGLP